MSQNLDDRLGPLVRNRAEVSRVLRAQRNLRLRCLRWRPHPPVSIRSPDSRVRGRVERPGLRTSQRRKPPKEIQQQTASNGPQDPSRIKDVQLWLEVQHVQRDSLAVKQSHRRHQRDLRPAVLLVGFHPVRGIRALELLDDRAGVLHDLHVQLLQRHLRARLRCPPGQLHPHSSHDLRYCWPPKTL